MRTRSSTWTILIPCALVALGCGDEAELVSPEVPSNVVDRSQGCSNGLEVIRWFAGVDAVCEVNGGENPGQDMEVVATSDRCVPIVLSSDMPDSVRWAGNADLDVLITSSPGFRWDIQINSAVTAFRPNSPTGTGRAGAGGLLDLDLQAPDDKKGIWNVRYAYVIEASAPQQVCESIDTGIRLVANGPRGERELDISQLLNGGGERRDSGWVPSEIAPASSYYDVLAIVSNQVAMGPQCSSSSLSGWVSLAIRVHFNPVSEQVIFDFDPGAPPYPYAHEDHALVPPVLFRGGENWSSYAAPMLDSIE